MLTYRHFLRKRRLIAVAVYFCWTLEIITQDDHTHIKTGNVNNVAEEKMKSIFKLLERDL